MEISVFQMCPITLVFTTICKICFLLDLIGVSGAGSANVEGLLI